VADRRPFLGALPADLVERFEQAGWLLIRNYTRGHRASLADAFGTDYRGAVESTAVPWIDFDATDGALRTRQRRRAVVPHPINGRRCCSIRSLPETSGHWPGAARYPGGRLRRDGCVHTRFGTGDRSARDIVQTINQAYEAHTVCERWEAATCCW